jgi:alpha-tubulin suppressor-like RCC1 family protein
MAGLMHGRGRYRRLRTAVAVAVVASVLATAGLLVGIAGADPALAATNHPIAQVTASVDGGDLHTCAVQVSRVVKCWGRNTFGQSTAPVGTFGDVSAGGSFSCGIKTDGTLACWGKNDVGQATPPAGIFRQLAAGGTHACAVKTDGSEVCWGSNALGQTTAQPGLKFRQVTSGDNHTCAMRGDGLVLCWGDNSQGQAVNQATSFIQISAGGQHTCGVQGNGTVACWGANGANQSTPPAGTFREVSSGGQHTCGLTSAGAIVCWGSNVNGQTVAPAGTFTAVTAGGSHSCGVRTDGSAVCWGLNVDHQSKATVGVYNSRAVDAGFLEACGIRTDGLLACWGDNSFGESSSPTGTFWQVSAGLGFSCAIRSDGTLACWGNGYPGSPVPVPPTGTFREVRVSPAGGFGGKEFACGIRSSGALACWGDPAGAVNPPATVAFQLGVGQTHACAVMTGGALTCWGGNTQGQSTAPTGSFLDVNAEDYNGGSMFTSCALRTDGAILCWGSNGTGQAAPGAGPWTQFDLGSRHGCGVHGDGTPACWGLNDSGEASPPAGLLGVTAAQGFGCGVKIDGNVVCWGANDSGQLGGTSPHYTSAGAPGAMIGQPYSHRFAVNGLATNTFRVSSGQLPPGVTLDPLSGTLSGSPTALGTYTGAIVATNGFFFPDVSQAFTITVLPVRTVSIADKERAEGASGAPLVNIPVTISAPVPSGQTVSVGVSTVDETATAGSDYTAVSATLTWNPGDALSKNVSIPVSGDTRKEGVERFRIDLTTFANVVPADASASFTILDDDGSFYVSVNDAAVTEGNTGTVLAQFAVTLSTAVPAGQSVSVQVATADGTAGAGTDYTALSTSVTWVSGTSLTQYVKITVAGDTLVEPTETFALNLSAPTGPTVISDAAAVATIANDD